MSPRHGKPPRPKAGAPDGKPVARRTQGAGRQFALWITMLVVAGFGLQLLNRGAPRPGAPVNARGLRVSGEGRADATRVLPAALFADQRARRAYEIAHRIPGILNQLYCWCGCIERTMRSNLECFESQHAADCDQCLVGAEVAWELYRQGIADPAAVPRRIDQRSAPPS